MASPTTQHRSARAGGWRAAAVLLATAVLGAAADASAQLAAGGWPAFHGNAQHTGQALVAGPATATVKWTYPATDAVKGSPSVAPDGTVYVAFGYSLCAVHPDGTEKWCAALSGEATRSAPAIAEDGTVYFGARDNRLYAFRPDGTVSWRYLIKNDGDVRTSPMVGADGTVYFAGTWNGLVHAVHPSDGHLLWKYKTGSTILWSSPAIDDVTGTIYIGSTDGALHAFSPAGVHLWRCKLQGLNRSSSPAVGPDGTVYMGTTAGVSAVDATGTLKWFFPTKGYVEATPAIAAGGTIYAGTTTGKRFYAISPTGGQVWMLTAPGAVAASAAIGVDGIVYVGMGSVVRALRPNGTTLWQHTTGGLINSSPAIGPDGTLYIGSSDGQLYAFGD